MTTPDSAPTGQTPPPPADGTKPNGGNQPPANPPKPPDPYAKWKRWARMGFAIALFIGTIPLPFPFGTVGHIIAISMLVRDSKTVRVLVAKARRRWPTYADKFLAVGKKVLPKMIGELDELTNPDKILGPPKPPKTKFVAMLKKLAGSKTDVVPPPPPAQTRFSAFPVRSKAESRLPVDEIIHRAPAPANDVEQPSIARRRVPQRLPRL